MVNVRVIGGGLVRIHYCRRRNLDQRNRSITCVIIGLEYVCFNVRDVRA